MKKEYLLDCLIVCFTLFMSKDFFASELFYNLFVNHRFIMPIMLSVIVTLLVACVLLLIKFTIQLRKNNKEYGKRTEVNEVEHTRQ